MEDERLGLPENEIKLNVIKYLTAMTQISNLFIEDYRRVIQRVEHIRLRSNARRCLATSLPYQREVWRDCIYEPEADPRYHKKRGNPIWISSMVGHSIEISNPFIKDYRCVIKCVEHIRLRSNARRYLATSLPYQREVWRDYKYS